MHNAPRMSFFSLVGTTWRQIATLSLSFAAFACHSQDFAAQELATHCDHTRELSQVGQACDFEGVCLIGGAPPEECGNYGLICEEGLIEVLDTRTPCPQPRDFWTRPDDEGVEVIEAGAIPITSGTTTTAPDCATRGCVFDQPLHLGALSPEITPANIALSIAATRGEAQIFFRYDGENPRIAHISEGEVEWEELEMTLGAGALMLRGEQRLLWARGEEVQLWEADGETWFPRGMSLKYGGYEGSVIYDAAGHVHAVRRIGRYLERLYFDGVWHRVPLRAEWGPETQTKMVEGPLGPEAWTAGSGEVIWHHPQGGVARVLTNAQDIRVGSFSREDGANVPSAGTLAIFGDFGNNLFVASSDSGSFEGIDRILCGVGCPPTRRPLGIFGKEGGGWLAILLEEDRIGVRNPECEGVPNCLPSVVNANARSLTWVDNEGRTGSLGFDPILQNGVLYGNAAIDEEGTIHIVYRIGLDRFYTSLRAE